MNKFAARVEYIRGPALRKRWGGMSNSTFYAHLSEGRIPAPVYPFGNGVPYWRMGDIERHEAAAAERAGVVA